MRVVLVLICGCWLGLGTLSAGTLAQFRTVFGDLEVELYDADKPVTVTNFIHYVESGAYSNLFIHRWEPLFVIQSGGYHMIERHTTNVAIKAINTVAVITNEYKVGRTFSNVYGTIAMARQEGVTNSATSQWFINLTNNSGLDFADGGFTVFGHVVGGTNVLNVFNDLTTNSPLYRANLGGALTKLPVTSVRPTFEDVVYVDITLLHVRVNGLADGSRDISWRSISNRVHRVEFTTQFPPLWQELSNTNGTGSEIHILDDNREATNRFYRVRVDY